MHSKSPYKHTTARARSCHGWRVVTDHGYAFLVFLWHIKAIFRHLGHMASEQMGNGWYERTTWLGVRPHTFFVQGQQTIRWDVFTFDSNHYCYLLSPNRFLSSMVWLREASQQKVEHDRKHKLTIGTQQMQSWDLCEVELTEACCVQMPRHLPNSSNTASFVIRHSSSLTTKLASLLVC